MSECDKVGGNVGIFGFVKADKLRKKPAILREISIEQQAHIAGLDGDADIITEPLVPVASPDDTRQSGPPNTEIAMGPDRPAELGTGSGKGSIYIVAGQSERLKNTSPVDKDGVSLQVNRNFNLDNSIIYLTAEAAPSIDDYFGIAAGKMGKSKERAAIAIKSDDVRIIARKGIKLVTGTDVENSKGGTTASISGIELIAGNDDTGTKLQPIPKGDNLVAAFRALKKIVHEQIAATRKFAHQQHVYNEALKEHTHPDVVNMIVSLIAANNLKGVTSGETLQDPAVMVEGSCAAQTIGNIVLGELDSIDTALVQFDNDYLKATSETKGNNSYINSRYNKVN